MADELVKCVLTIEPSADNPRNSEGAIMQLSDGSLLLAYTRFTGGAGDNSAAQISARSCQPGKWEWTPDRIIVEREGKENVMSVSSLPMAKGGIFLFYAVKDSWGDCRLYYRATKDDFRSLEERRLIMEHVGYYVVNNDRVVRLSNGRIVVPAALHACPDGTRKTWTHRGVSMCFLSDDEGLTWHRSKTALVAPPQSRTGFQEPGVVELEDGRLMLWTRTDMGCQFISFSEDAGETWSEAGKSNLASPVSPASIKRLPWDGRLMVVWNDHSGRHPFPKGRRTPLCAATSADEGKTWSASKAVEADPDGWYCYTAIAFLEDTVVLGYCAGDKRVGGLNRLRVTTIHKDWLP